MTAYATGKHAFQICDRCARRVRYGELTDQIMDRRSTGLLVCRQCLDEDHPQLQVGRLRIRDPQSLRDQRGEDYRLSRGTFGWSPCSALKLTVTLAYKVST